MNAKHTIVKKQGGITNWDAIGLMTEDEINAAVATDPDAQPLTLDQWWA